MWADLTVMKKFSCFFPVILQSESAVKSYFNYCVFYPVYSLLAIRLIRLSILSKILKKHVESARDKKNKSRIFDFEGIIAREK